MAGRIVTYKCPFCDKRFNREDLVVHVEDNHPYEVPKDFKTGMEGSVDIIVGTRTVMDYFLELFEKGVSDSLIDK